MNLKTLLHLSLLLLYLTFLLRVNVEIWLSRTRYPYHRKCFTSIKNNHLFFHIYGECYHNPLVNEREIYHVSLERNADPSMFTKGKLWKEVMEDYEFLKTIRDRIDEVDKIPTATRYQLSMVYDKAKRIGKNIDLLTSDEILNLSGSKHL